MSQVEYRVFNMSEAEVHNKRVIEDHKRKNWLEILNEHGLDGWRVVCKLTKSSFLMMRETKVSVL